MPSDVKHSGSRATQAQRKRFTAASKRWSKLPPIVRADLQQNIAIVDKTLAHGLSTIDVLQGRQLFVSLEIHQQKYHDAHAEVPPWLCIQTRAPYDVLLPFHPNLYYRYFQPGFIVPRYPLVPGNTFYYPVPETPYAYAFDVAAWYIYEGWSPSWTFDELLKLRHLVCLPAIYESALRSYPAITNPTFPNWQFLPPAYTWTWWRVNVYQPRYDNPSEYHPDVMAQFTFDHYQTDKLKITILPLAFDYTENFHGYWAMPHPRYWRVEVTAPGQWTLHPDKHTVIINQHSGHIIDYED